MTSNPEQHHGGAPEEGERLSINSIVIPSGEEYELRQDEIGSSTLPDYQRRVGGLIEHIGFNQPAASMYVNEEGKINELPLNRRATLLVWMHNPAFRYQDIIVGDALLTGPADEHGRDTNVPDELSRTLFEAKHFRPEVQVYGESGWHTNSRRFDNWVDAYSYVLDLGRRWTSVEDVRVVPEA